MLSTTDAPQDQGARQHAAPEEDEDSDDELIVIPATSPEAIVDLTSEESSEEINQAELFRSENPVLQAALNSKKDYWKTISSRYPTDPSADDDANCDGFWHGS